ncbi:MAG TPA: hypothetical protein VK254_02385 [Candidatus Bathyarchaeia archaeon]|nr:hypothetical protein [Candidatus Bathyarchaeia archaeon]
MFNPKREKLYIILFFTVLTVILTWPTAWHFFSSVPSSGSDTMQVIGVAGDKANLISDQGFFKGTFELIKRSEFNITALYAYFQLVFGRIAGYNILFFSSFILSGFGTYLLAFHFTKNKPASLVAGIIFAFSPFHIHNSLSTNVGTMHQEWLPFFALYLFKFFEDLSLKNFSFAALFLLLIGFTEHQLLAFTVIFLFIFLIYKLFSQPKIFLRPKFWIYAAASALVLSALFFFMFRSLFVIAGSDNNYLDAGLKSAVKYSNDSLSILIPPNFHSFWPSAFSKIRNQFDRNSDSTFSSYAGYSVLCFSLLGIFGARYLKKRNVPTAGIFFWLVAAIGIYVLSWGPYLHYKGVLDPPVKMPYYLIYQYFPFYKNIRTVGRFFVWSMLSFSVLAAWGMTFMNKKSKILFFVAGMIVVLEFLAVPMKTDSLLHSSFYEKLGQDKEEYSVLEVPGSTSYDFASRDLVWKSIHRKSTINAYDFARINKEDARFQTSTPIIQALLYDIPGGASGSGTDIMKDSYYDISSEILKYYNIRWIILDKEGLKGNPAKGDPNLLYPAKAYISSVIKCADEYEDNFLYACKTDQSVVPIHMFLTMDVSNPHWIGKSDAKNGLQRYAENGAGIKLVNMTGQPQNGRLHFNVKVSKPLRVKVFLNGQEFFNQYITTIRQKQGVSADLSNINSGENDITFGVYGADGSEIYSDKKIDAASIYQVGLE